MPWVLIYNIARHGDGMDGSLDRDQVRCRAQLGGYAVLLHAPDPRPTRLPLYYPAMAAWRAWV